MTFEQVELRGASITTKADIGKGRSAVTVGLDANERGRGCAGMPKSYSQAAVKFDRTCFLAHLYFICPPKRWPFTWNSTELREGKSKHRMPRWDR